MGMQNSVQSVDHSFSRASVGWNMGATVFRSRVYRSYRSLQSITVQYSPMQSNTIQYSPFTGGRIKLPHHR